METFLVVFVSALAGAQLGTLLIELFEFLVERSERRRRRRETRWALARLVDAVEKGRQGT